MSIGGGGPKRHALGVDFGSSNTVAVARWPDGRARPILVDGSPLLPSAVYAEPDGDLIAGRDAVHSARIDPARFEPNPKRRVDDGMVLLGEREVPVADLIAAVLARVAEEWRRTVGPAPTDVTLTCPATWGSTRRGLLAAAAERGGLEGARLVAEPVAAATYFADVLGRDVPIGSVVVVHDFGAGTFDASVVARTAEGFEVLAVDGRDDVGGLDVDAAIVDYLTTQHPDADWNRLAEPSTVEERRARRQLWDDVRVAKERLSRSQSADLVVPLLDLEIHLTRDELEKVARPVLDQTVAVTRELLRWADLPDGRLAGVFLVGGASRIPLLATLLHRELGEAPVVIEQPELVVAEGSILADEALLASGPAAPGPTEELRLVLARVTEAAVSGPSPHQDPATVRVSKSSPDSPTDPAGPSRPLAAAGRGGPSSTWPGVAAPGATLNLMDGSLGSLPAVDPWPHAAPDPWPAIPHARPVPAVRRPAVRPSSPGLAATRIWVAPGARPRPAPRPAPQYRPRQDYRPRPTRVRRRPGGFVRFLRALIIIVLLIVVPAVAMVFAYGYGTGQSFQDAARQLVADLVDFYRTHVA